MTRSVGVSGRAALLLCSPWLLILAVFWAYPLAYALVLALSDFHALTRQWRFVGLENFAGVLGDGAFWHAVGNTVFFVAGTVPVTTILALFLALALNRRIPGRAVFRAGFFAPTLTATVVVALVFLHLYAQGGYLHRLAALFGLAPERGFLLEPSTALPAVMLMDIWVSVGYYTLLFLAALQSIADDLYEAAALDGASWRHRLSAIVLPHLRPMTLYIVVINTIKSFQVFTEIFVMTQGGPIGSTTTAVYYVYRLGFERFTLGRAAAAAYVLFALIGVVIWLQARYFNRRQATG